MPIFAPFERNLLYVFLFIAAFITVSLLTLSAKGETAKPHPLECPTPQPCRILTLNADEQNALLGQNQILDTAQQGRPLDLSGAVQYFRNKIQNAPAGTVPPEPKK